MKPFIIPSINNILTKRYNLFIFFKNATFTLALLWLVFFWNTNAMAQINFGLSTLQNLSIGTPTSLEFGPDGRLYVSNQNGKINIYTIQRNAANDYEVLEQEEINLIYQMPNRNDNGSFNTSLLGRQVTGILVSGTSEFPSIYVGSSDPRHGAGSSGTDTGLDTNSGIISRLDWNGTQWTKIDLVRGLPRSEENHSSNGMQLDEANNILYVTQGGHTNMGAISNNFAFHTEYAYSAAILAIDLNMIGNTTYDLPTLDDEDKNNVSTTAGFEDEGDPFGGNNGKNQAILELNGPVQIFSSGWRNAYDVLITENGRFYTFDNGPNGGWGDAPSSCVYAQEEPGQTYPDNLHLISQDYYGGHPNLTRANRTNTFNTTNPQTPIPLGMENPVECQYLIPELEDGAILTIPFSTNGLAEYSASNFGGAMQGNLLAAALASNGQINRIELNAAGDELVPNGNTVLLSGFAGGGFSLDVIAQADGEPFAGTIWAANIYGANPITIFEPADYNGGNVGTCTPTVPTEDSDNDGFTNQDETDNNTDPCSAASKPSDWDGDFVSDLNDNDDDNDNILDINDLFALDSLNGTATFMPIDYAWDNGVAAAGGLLNLGFTGFMNNATDDYLNLFDTENMTAGGAAGVFTIDEVPAGDAFLNDNSQAYGFQFGVNVSAETNIFFAHTSVLAPFAGFIPQDNQSVGIFAGDGTQSHYAKIACVANGGAGGIEFLIEENDAIVFQETYNVPILTANFVELFLIFNPDDNSIQAAYALDNGGRVNIGTPQTVSSSLFNVLAVGLIATSEGSNMPFATTWADIAIQLDPLAVTGAWEEMPCNAFPTCSSEPTHRHENAYVQLGDKFYLVGGRGLKNVQIYHPQDNTWTNGATPPLELHHFQAVEWHGLLYVIGAFTGDFPHETPVPNVYIYDPLNDEWIEGAEIPANRQRGSAGAVVYNDKIYVVNGIVDGHSADWVNWLDEYDPSTNTWAILPDSPQARDHFHAAIHDGNIYVAAGRRSGQNTTFSPTVAEIEQYNIGTQTWTTLPNDIPTQRAGASVAVLGDEILVIGGESETQIAAHNETEAFHTLTQTWRTLDTLKAGRHGMQAIVNNNNIYIAAGSGNRGGGPQLNTQEVFYLYENTTPVLNAIAKGTTEVTSTMPNFSSVGLEHSRTQTITLKNTIGNQALLVEEVNLIGSNEFSLNETYDVPVIIKPEEKLDIAVTFVPVSENLQTANLMIAHTGSNTVIDIEMNGSSSENEIRINCGGENYVDDLGNLFVADTFYNEMLTTYTFSEEIFINNTLDGALYQTERNAYINDLQYDIPVSPNASYRVLLHFAELYWTSPNSRIFDVSIENEILLNDFDIFAEAGTNTALVKEFVVLVADTTLNINLIANANAAKIAAIEIIRDDNAIPNTPPNFTISDSDVLLEQDFQNLVTVNVTPDTVPFEEQYQIVTYSLSPAGVDFADVSIDSASGDITILAVPDAYGTQTFTITADDGQSNNNIVTQQFSLTVSISAENFEGININCAGNAYTDSNGKEFIADEYFLPQYTTFADNTSQNIANTNEEFLYQSYRKAYINDLRYAIPVPNHLYHIRLHFAENFVNEAGSRVFDINIENNLALDDFDIFAEAGKHTALIKEFQNVDITDGFVNIDFSAGGGQLAVISAIEIVKANIGNTPPNFTLSDDILVTENFTSVETVTITPDAVPTFEQSQVVTYSISPSFCLFANVLFNSSTGTATITSVPNMTGTKNFTITANDGQTEDNTCSQTFMLTVAHLNTPPTFAISQTEINVMENFGTTETITVTPDAVLSEESDQVVTYTLSPATISFADVNINASTGNITISAIPNEYGTQMFTIEANDHQTINNIATQSFTLTVNPLNPPNTAPAFTLSGDVSVEQDFVSTEYVTVVPAAVPPSEAGQVVTYTLTPPNVAFATVNINSSNGTVSISAVPDGFGTQIFTITADDSQTENNIYTQDFTLTVNELSTIFPLIRINCGGNDYTSIDGDFFEADNYFSTQNTTFAGGSGSFIANTDDDLLYRSDRRGYITDMRYAIPVPNNDTYMVRLHFAELVVNAVGQRVFDINMENNLVLSDFDIFDEVGKNAAFIEEFSNIEVLDGFLNIDFIANSGQLSKISAIEVWQGTSTPNTPPTFSISTNELILSQDFATTETINITPDAVPSNEQNQIVTYSLSPASVDFANVSINENTGNIEISAISSAYGTQIFTITANDGEAYNNLATQTFLLDITPLNTPPTFTTSGDISAFTNFSDTETLTVIPNAVPTGEESQVVAYSISPASVDFANISINSADGTVSITAVTDSIGTQVFTITANDGEPTNNLATQTFTLTINPLGVEHIRINCGGGQYTTTQNETFITDDFYETVPTTYAYTTTNSISNTIDDAIYQSERKAYINELQYAIAVLPFHECLVRLHFSELSVGVVGGRVFDVFIEDSLILNDYDIFADVGKNVATYKEFFITSKDDMLNINFWAENGAAKISAIEVISMQPAIIATSTSECETPTGLHEVVVLPNSVTLSWNPMVNASGYIVRGRKQGSSNIYVSDILLSNTVTYNVLPNTTYRWTVSAICPEGESEYGEIRSFTTPTGKVRANHLVVFGESKQTDSEIKIYPNPTSKYITISFFNTSEHSVTVTIANTLGKTLRYQQYDAILGEQKIKLDLSDLLDGLYFVSIDNGFSIKTKYIYIKK
ncbi:MAG: malectin domain-containing carbohydrate-binding protein [Chitinophagales bacterium]